MTESEFFVRLTKCEQIAEQLRRDREDLRLQLVALQQQLRALGQN